jgi:antitoxin component YwqK of YwqJK toxin-antitoxin module
VRGTTKRISGKSSSHKDGKKHGLTTSYYDDGSKKEEGHYKDGKETRSVCSISRGLLEESRRIPQTTGREALRGCQRGVLRVAYDDGSDIIDI